MREGLSFLGQQSILDNFPNRLGVDRQHVDRNLDSVGGAGFIGVKDRDRILAGIGRTGSKIDPGIMAAPPATISTTMVSPIALDIPRITAVDIPEIAAGVMTLQMVSQWVAPRAREASFSSLGTLKIASSEMLHIVGMDIKASISEALKRFNPVAIPRIFCRNGATMTIPKKPITTEGKAAKSSTTGLTNSLTRNEATSAK